MNAEVITIGDEILIGQTVDTNSAWLGNEFNLIGIDIVQITSIPDKRERIISALKDAETRAEVIVLTGGLGPTQDDITKSTLCEYFDSKLVRNEEVLGRIQDLFDKRGKTMLEGNRQQADIPEAATVINNYNGSASGMWFEKNDKIFVSMPGVPYEMKSMMSGQVFPELAKRFDLEQIIHYTALTQGVGESVLANKLVDWEAALRKSGLSLAYLPSAGAVKLRVTSKGLSNGRELIDQFSEELHVLVGDYIFGYNGQSLEEVVGDLLRSHNATVATAESCTGGNIAQLITSISGSSDYFIGSVVSYSNQVKIDQLGVKESSIEKHGAVSEEVVSQMANGIKASLKTDYAIATSGVAGPTGGTREKPVGTIWIAVSGPESTVAKQFKFGDNRQRNVTVTTLTGLNMLRKMLK